MNSAPHALEPSFLKCAHAAVTLRDTLHSEQGFPRHIRRTRCVAGNISRDASPFRKRHWFDSDLPMISLAVKPMLQCGKEFPTKKLSLRSG